MLYRALRWGSPGSLGVLKFCGWGTRRNRGGTACNNPCRLLDPGELYGGKEVPAQTHPSSPPSSPQAWVSALYPGWRPAHSSGRRVGLGVGGAAVGPFFGFVFSHSYSLKWVKVHPFCAPALHPSLCLDLQPPPFPVPSLASFACAMTGSV